MLEDVLSLLVLLEVPDELSADELEELLSELAEELSPDEVLLSVGTESPLGTSKSVPSCLVQVLGKLFFLYQPMLTFSQASVASKPVSLQ